MRRNSAFARCVFVPKHHVENLPAGSVVFDVSSYADAPYCALRPMWVHGGIPVPGMPGTTSDTVEGVWQGLKVIRGKTAPRYFRGPGQKRGGKPSGHQFGKRLLGIVEARRRIYVPAYEWMLENRIPHQLIESFIESAKSGVTQYFHDVGDNGDINDADAPLAHAAVLVQYINRACAARE
ncbi:MAG TPA: hypothetical protein VMZ71_01970 [Gemmataceae bacterium]|nr:hypothetical protein [Gemmataceae bacterium]